MKKLFALFMMLLLAAPALADDVAVPPALQKFRDNGGTVDFMGHAFGTDGWRIVPKDGGEARYAYTTPEGGLLLGILLRPDGVSETNEQLKALKAKKEGAQEALPGADKAAGSESEKVYAEIEKSGWARLGDEKAPYLYLFINTRCDHCQELWKDLEAPVRAGKLQVRLIPFGKIAENRDSGAALLSADDPLAAWTAFINGDQDALGKDKIKDGTLARVDANTALFADWKMQGPPFTVYRRPADGQVTVIVGRPENTMLVLADLMKGN
jgi:hypothetical protein